jgi:hypothetical protein
MLRCIPEPSLSITSMKIRSVYFIAYGSPHLIPLPCPNGGETPIVTARQAQSEAESWGTITMKDALRLKNAKP